MKISREVLKHRAHFDSTDAPYQNAFWVVLLHDEHVDTVEKLAGLTDGKAPKGLPNLLRCLRWANRHAHSQEQKQVKHGLDARAREQLLRKALVLSSFHARTHPQAALIQRELWGESFASLLLTPSEQTEKAWEARLKHGLNCIFSPPDAPAVSDLRKWLPNVDKSPSWPQQIQHLFDVMKSRAQARAIG